MKFIIYALAVWRLARLLVKEEGPLGLIYEFRVLTGIEHDDSGAAIKWPDWNPLHCVCCTSVWTAALLLLMPSVVHTWLASSAVAVLANDLEEVAGIFDG